MYHKFFVSHLYAMDFPWLAKNQEHPLDYSISCAYERKNPFQIAGNQQQNFNFRYGAHVIVVTREIDTNDWPQVKLTPQVTPCEVGHME